MSHIRNGRTAQQLQTFLQQTLVKMNQNQKNGNYVQAQNNRIAAQQIKKDLQLRRVYEMEVRHREQMIEIQKAHNEQMVNFNNFWDKKLLDFQNEGQKLLSQMQTKHQNELERQREQLQKIHSLKVKESSECLNLRKMQQHMVKQKNYIEAHKVQQRIQQLQKQQKEVWMNNRNLKIQTALNTLRAKQSAELNNLLKRIKTGRQEQTKDRHNEQLRLKRKYQNIKKQLKMQQDKQVLAFKGQFKSKGGISSPMTKSKFLQTSSSR